jgi:hypothetical protein
MTVSIMLIVVRGIKPVVRHAGEFEKAFSLGRRCHVSDG